VALDPYGSPGSTAVIEVRLAPGSPEAAFLAQAAKDEPGSRKALSDLTSKFQRATRLPLDGRIDQAGRLLLSVDLRALTSDVVARLKKRADIADAQPNYSYGVRMPQEQ
jgi:hypothetical protein